VSYSTGAKILVSKILRVLKPHSLGIGIIPDLVQTHPSPTRYQTEFGGSKSNSMGIVRGPINFEDLNPWYGGTADP